MSGSSKQSGSRRTRKIFRRIVASAFAVSCAAIMYSGASYSIAHQNARDVRAAYDHWTRESYVPDGAVLEDFVVLAADPATRFGRPAGAAFDLGVLREWQAHQNRLDRTAWELAMNAAFIDYRAALNTSPLWGMAWSSAAFTGVYAKNSAESRRLAIDQALQLSVADPPSRQRALTALVSIPNLEPGFLKEALDSIAWRMHDVMTLSEELQGAALAVGIDTPHIRQAILDLGESGQDAVSNVSAREGD